MPGLSSITNKFGFSAPRGFFGPGFRLFGRGVAKSKGHERSNPRSSNPFNRRSTGSTKISDRDVRSSSSSDRATRSLSQIVDRALSVKRLNETRSDGRMGGAVGEVVVSHLRNQTQSGVQLPPHVARYMAEAEGTTRSKLFHSLLATSVAHVVETEMDAVRESIMQDFDTLMQCAPAFEGKGALDEVSLAQKSAEERPLGSDPKTFIDGCHLLAGDDFHDTSFRNFSNARQQGRSEFTDITTQRCDFLLAKEVAARAVPAMEASLNMLDAIEKSRGLLTGLTPFATRKHEILGKIAQMSRTPEGRYALATAAEALRDNRKMGAVKAFFGDEVYGEFTELLQKEKGRIEATKNSSPATIPIVPTPAETRQEPNVGEQSVEPPEYDIEEKAHRIFTSEEGKVLREIILDKYKCIYKDKYTSEFINKSVDIKINDLINDSDGQLKICVALDCIKESNSISNRNDLSFEKKKIQCDVLNQAARDIIFSREKLDVFRT